MGKIASEWGKEYKKYGYQNAEEYGESFKNRLTQTMGKMTGFQIENDGTLQQMQQRCNALLTALRKEAYGETSDEK